MMLSIRLATVADAGTIHRAVLGIAEHVGETHRVTSTADDIRRHGFGERPAFRALIAEADGGFAGLCLFFPSFSTWKGRPGVYVQDLFVDPAYRGKGVGERLLKAVARLAREEGAIYLRLSVDAKNHAGRAFYDRLGMKWADQEMIRTAYDADFVALAEDTGIGAETGTDR
jgi:GNAT superfamily N-acetyltransferase